MFHDLYRWPFLVAALVLAALEAVYILRIRREAYDGRQAAASLGVAIGNMLTRPLVTLSILAVAPVVAALSPWRLPDGNPLVWVAGFVAFEFMYYWMHRLSHTVRWLWATHAVHHSADGFTLPAAIRLGWTNALSGEWLFYMPLVVLGFSPTLVATLAAIDLGYQFILHTEMSPRWGLFEHVLNTPAHHRVHHASNPQYLDKNFGGVLIIFDKWFGTFAEDDGREPLRFGLTHPMGSNNPVVIALREWQHLGRDVVKVRSAPALWRVLFGPPTE